MITLKSHLKWESLQAMMHPYPKPLVEEGSFLIEMEWMKHRIKQFLYNLALAAMEVVYIRDLLIIYREYDHIQIVYTFEPFSFLFTTYLPT